MLVAMAALFACKSQKSREKTTLGDLTPWQDYPELLNGNVKEVQELNYWAVDQNGVVEKGNLITTKERDSIGWSYDFTAQFNEAGQVLKSSTLDENGKILSSWVVTIDSGKYTAADYTWKDTIRNHAKIVQDEKGNIVEALMYKPGNDTLQGRYVNTYDEAGNRVLSQWMNIKGEKGGYQASTWDANHHKLEVKFFNKKDSLTLSYVMTYDEKGFMNSQKVYNGKQELKGDMTMTSKDFDEKGNYLQTVTYKDGKPYILTVRTYTYY
jgi:hypothetical protein